MQYKIEVLEGAKSDLIYTGSWYEDQKIGLGVRFIDHTEGTFKRITTNPEIGQIFEEPFRRVVLTEFPYCIFYFLESSKVIIVRILHSHRDPRAVEKLVREQYEKNNLVKILPTTIIS